MKKRLCFIHRFKRRSGVTLVEMVVSMLLVSIMMAMVVGILSPAAKIFLRMQRLQYAQQVLDNTAAQLRSMAGEATKYVKIYADASDIEGNEGEETVPDASGTVLEFVNPEGYATLLSTDGISNTTKLMVGGVDMGNADEVKAGRLAVRYYNIADNSTDQYYYTDGSNPIARAAGSIFGDGYYMGNYVKIEFKYPPGTAAGNPLTYLVATISLYNNEDRLEEHLVAREDTVLDFRYSVKPKKDPTAASGP